MGGSTKQQTNSRTRTEPWGPTQGPLKGVVNQAAGLLDNTALTPTETGALDTLTANANAGNPYAPAIGQLATDMLAGGPDRTGIAMDAYNKYQAQIDPFASGAMNDPYKNPAMQGLLDRNAQDIYERINAAYAGSGRSVSGSQSGFENVARGITEGNLPTLYGAYNDAVNRQFNAINSLYGAGNTTAGLLNNLDTSKFNTQLAGIGAAQSALNANDAASMRLLQIEAQRRGIPVQNLAQAAGILTPIAQLGGTSQTNQSTTTSTPVANQIIGGTVGGLGLLGQTGAFGPAGWLLSDRKMKTDIARVGQLDDGTPVYRFRYKSGGPVQIGLMADEVRTDAVHEVGGIKFVDYRLATENAVNAHGNA